MTLCSDFYVKSSYSLKRSPYFNPKIVNGCFEEIKVLKLNAADPE
ncbi:hypothetical protein MmTuc01_2332 [Methanosarcina mazei Tuc01]|uniref:Uncharacterized protein n=1 Tax=Methanosarcina mazei Tuc01 TaxID=1236903 RepID=M1PAU4_METMZ|nr:hypothetical protein [Methanosarcina mazei]AGF97647.1 hypothetical protein MmTuc01_2332 [Methanosarcina mazei Tuc01]